MLTVLSPQVGGWRGQVFQILPHLSPLPLVSARHRGAGSSGLQRRCPDPLPAAASRVEWRPSSVCPGSQPTPHRGGTQSYLTAASSGHVISPASGWQSWVPPPPLRFSPKRLPSPGSAVPWHGGVSSPCATGPACRSQSTRPGDRDGAGSPPASPAGLCW